MARIVSTGKTISLAEYHKKRLKERRRRFAFFLSGIALFLLVFLLLLRIDGLRITAVSVEGTDSASASGAVALSEQALTGSYLWLVPRNSFLFYPEKKIRLEILSKAPRFKSVDISLGGTNSLLIKVSEREPFALYCKIDSCFFLDENGVIYDTAPDFSHGVYFVYSLAEPLLDPLSQNLIPPEEFKTLTTFLQSLSSLVPAPREVRISPDSVSLALENGAVIRWRRVASHAELLSNMRSFLESQEISSDVFFWQNLRELDLRTEDKVFYKFNSMQ